ncbi:hypothetical protein OF83DRAFT_1207515 [Amylostereum chailletii]|nr:hypothetical protein OF83DRAFT_1207515 [Amylostereum chailletii]
MGRRKIEIQPITNERNRAVTFLKASACRKSGLFKKAYELGVLCSVDVAVIIFERRQGHPDKLFQYCSTDINNIVQRQLRFEGERDTRTPQDFNGGNPNALKDEDGGEDDDEGDGDDPGSPVQRKRSDSKGKQGKKEIDVRALSCSFLSTLGRSS